MKKRILGLALALIMIISLLPLTAFAAAPSDPKIVFYNGGNSDGRIDVYGFKSKAAYVVVENRDGVDYAVKASTAPTDNYLQISWANDTITMHFKNFVYSRTSGASSAFASVSLTGDYHINVVLEGTNSITGAGSGNYSAFTFANTGNITFSGIGDSSLTLSTKLASDAMIKHVYAGSMTIKDTTLNIATYTGTSGETAMILNNGTILVENADVEMTIPHASGLRAATAPGSGLTDNNITVKNSNLKITQTAGHARQLIETNGTVTFDNSNVELIGQANCAKVMAKAPTITGTYSAQKYSYWAKSESNFNEKNYTAAAFDGEKIQYLKLVHEHVAAEDDHNCMTGAVCACGHVITPGAAAHIAGANADDCTKDTMCGNPGCTQVFEAATATAHTPKADDGDCTTDILCANPGCTQVATKGAEKHKDTRTDCAVAGTCANTGCTHTFTAGQHTGGTATCKAKAKCEICSKEYGELAACTPAADDGNCETAIKCSVCGKETTAAKTHKYTDKADTTCDNPGCTNTRKVEGTENPKTGDNTALVLVATLMVAAAAAFVTSKKFVR